MTPAEISAIRKLWTATATRPCHAHAKGPRKVTLDKLVSRDFAKVINRGYVLTKEGHEVATELMKSGWKANTA